MRRINVRKRGKVYEYFFDRESFDAIKKILGKYRIYNITPYLLNQALLKLYQKTGNKESLRNYQKVIKSSLRDAANYFGFIEGNPAGNLQIPRVLSFELKKTEQNIFIPKKKLKEYY